MSQKEYKNREIEIWLDANKREMIDGEFLSPPGGFWAFQEFMEEIAGIGYSEDFFENATEEDIKEKNCGFNNIY